MFPDFGSYLKPFSYKHPKTRFAILQDCPFQQKIHNFAHWFAFMFELFLLWTIIEAQVSILQDRLKIICITFRHCISKVFKVGTALRHSILIKMKVIVVP